MVLLRTLICVLVGTLGLVACAEQDSVGVDVDVADALAAADTAGTVDIVTADAPDLTGGDGKVVAGDGKTDSAPVDPCAFMPKPDGCSCDGDVECASGFCNSDGFDKQCGAECTDDEDCGPGYACIVSATGGGCAYLFSSVCNPCLEDEECATVLDKHGFCLSYGGEGRFCSVACQDESDCPDGHVCTTTGEGTACKPKFGLCGCSDEAITDGLSTDCFEANDLGTCYGTRKCGDDGLTKCNALVPAEDLCDGIDNDCNGTVDVSADGSPLEKTCAMAGCPIEGLKTCQDGAWTECQVPGMDEVCGDDEDNDCDGQVDEEWPGLGEACTLGDGQCQADGVFVCPEDPAQPAVCDAQPGEAAMEKCDGLDNDCDGQVDQQGAVGCEQYFVDADQDGFGLSDSFLCLCEPDETYVAKVAEDCDDGDAEANPGLDEVCDDKDNDCDGDADEPEAFGCVPYYLDVDLDGYGAGEPLCLCHADIEKGYVVKQGGDCNDEDEIISPAADFELCDGIDNNCDGLVDLSFGGNPMVESCYAGPDGTAGFGICVEGISICQGGAWSQCIGQVLPLTEVCDAIDNDCDKLVDEGEDDEPLSEECYEGVASTLGVGECAAGSKTCFAGKWTSCQDQVLSTDEICDDKDNDCDAKTDEGCDDDEDGYCDVDMVVVDGTETCPKGGGDPDYDDQGVNPGAKEICNGIDDDVDGEVDEEDALGCKTYFLDQDGDGYGLIESLKCLCQPTGDYGALQAGDCNDLATNVNNGHAESCDSVDNDCDDEIDEPGALGCTPYFLDQDGDGFGVLGNSSCLCQADGDYDTTKAGDCADDDSAVNPNHPEVCDDKDNDCDNEVDEIGALACTNYYLDEDKDGFGTGIPQCLCNSDEEAGLIAVAAGDCADDADDINPGVLELCDAVDNNCDGLVDLGGGGTSLVEPCYTGLEGTAGVGVCNAGIQFCTLGNWSVCIGETVPSDESCDLKDNDCDTETDEDLLEICHPAEYTSEESFWDVPPCQPGISVCQDGAWTECDQYVLPLPEICADGLNNDCDGQVDELGSCAAECVGESCSFVVGGDDTGFNTDDNAADCDHNCGYNVSVDEDGNLILDVTKNLIDLPFMWVANDTDKTISKIDTETGKELARYTVGPECGSPSRTAVEESGSVWVGCRQGSRIVKIAAHKSDCVDKNGDGTIDTSWVEYGAGGAKTLHSLPWNIDECVVYHGTPPNMADAPDDVKNNPAPSYCNIYIRAVAVTKTNTVLFGGLDGCRDGHIWEASYQYDPLQPYQGDVNPRVEVVDHWYMPNLEHKDWNGNDCSFGGSPGGSYGYAVDKKGDMWISSLSKNHLYWVDMDERRSCSWGVNTSYGIAIDYASRIWLGSWHDDSAMGHVFVPETQTMHHITLNTSDQSWCSGTNLGCATRTRGTSVSVDAEHPHAYFAMSNGVAGVIKVTVVDEDPATFAAKVSGVVRTSNSGVCANSGSASGIGLDGEGDLWLIHMDACGTSVFDGKAHGGAVALQMNTDKVVGWKHPQNGADVLEVVNNLTDTGSHCYTYSDFMGYQFATVVSPSGFYVQRFTGWSVHGVYTTQWLELELAIEEPVQSPPLYVAYRAKDNLNNLGSSEFSTAEAVTCDQGLCTLVLPDLVLGTYFDIKLTVKTDDQGESVSVGSLKATGKRLLLSDM